MELTRFSLIKNLLKNRLPQLALFALMLAGFVFAIMTGFIGTPVGSHNFSIVFVWIAWWAILILVAVPFFGRGWCAVCPIPVVGDWLQRGAVLDPAPKAPKWLGLRVPAKLRNMWMQNLSFTLVALFSSVILTTPIVTSVVLAAMLFLAIGLSMVFERRAFCRYLCPVGGFIGLYAQTAPIELRVKDKNVCAKCIGKPCYNGSELGSGCPWDVFPGGLTKNTYCGLCMECIRTCPHDNIALNARPFSADLAKPSAKLDEAFKAFIMLGAALIYAYVLMGSNGTAKLAAYSVFTPMWFVYTAIFLTVIFILLPGMYWLAVKAGNLNLPLFGKRFAIASTPLIPLGLMFWVAFSLSFVLTNATYILAALSDPLGLGWNLFGTAAMPWQPVLSALVAPAQTLALVGGLAWAARTAQKTAPQANISPAPVIVYSFSATLLMLWLLL
uniref:4Fe-4S binding protein n=1 Tax=Anaerolinea thermolimosa TaxID=229919 RepID=A0A7C4KGI5_9CHLR